MAESDSEREGKRSSQRALATEERAGSRDSDFALGNLIPAYPFNFLGKPTLSGRGSASARTATMQRAQQTVGNRAVQRLMAPAGSGRGLPVQRIELPGMTCTPEGCTENEEPPIYGPPAPSSDTSHPIELPGMTYTPEGCTENEEPPIYGPPAPEPERDGPIELPGMTCTPEGCTENEEPPIYGPPAPPSDSSHPIELPGMTCTPEGCTDNAEPPIYGPPAPQAERDGPIELPGMTCTPEGCTENEPIYGPPAPPSNQQQQSPTIEMPPEVITASPQKGWMDGIMDWF